MANFAKFKTLLYRNYDTWGLERLGLEHREREGGDSRVHKFNHVSKYLGDAARRRVAGAIKA